MFEGFLADALNRALGEYCVGIDSEKIRVSAWQGDVELRNVQLKKTALDALRAPIALDAGYIGSLRLKVPWTNLGEEAVVVEIDRVFLLASRVTLAEAERNAADAGLSTLERTRREVDERTKKLEEAELDWLRTSMGKMTKQMQEEAERKDSWMWKTFHTVLGNLQVKVTNVHFRYEDTLTTPNNPFACGLTIEKMSAVTVDDSGQPTFTTGGALEGIHKHMALENFSWYLDSSERFSAWKTHADWEPPSVDDESQWWSLFGDGLSTEMSAKTRQYMCHPVTVELLYHRKGRKEETEAGEPRQFCDLRFENTRMTMTRRQYHNVMRLLEVFNQYRLRLPHANFRPICDIRTSPAMWWTYAKLAICSRKKNVTGRFEWSDIQNAGSKRRRYLAMYMTDGGTSNEEFLEEMEMIEGEFEFQVILAWRCIAHSKTKSVGEQGSVGSFTSHAKRARRKLIKSLAEEEQAKGGYFSWMWTSSSTKEDESAANLALSDDDWSKLEELIRGDSSDVDFDPKELGLEFSGVMKNLTLELKDHDNAGDDRLLVNSVMWGVQVTTKTYLDQSNTSFFIDGWSCNTESETILSTGMGASLHKHALKVKHNSFPLEHELDAGVDVQMAPVYVMYDSRVIKNLRAFYDSIDVSETDLATLEDEALVKLEEAKDSTTAALSKIKMTFDIYAPKVTIPVARDGKILFQTLVDFGHFKMQADPLDPAVTFDRKTGAPEYTILLLESKNTGVYIAESTFDWKRVVSGDLSDFCESLIAPCDAKMHFASASAGWTPQTGPRSKIEMSTNSFQLFVSPSKLARLYATLATMQEKQISTTNSTEIEDVKPWHGALISGAASAMKVGLVGAAGGYHTRWLCCQGPYLYILEADDADTYVDYVRVGYNVRVSTLDAADDTIQGPLLVIHDAKVPKSRAIELNNTWVFRFKEEKDLDKWTRWLQDVNEVAVATRTVQASTGDQETEDGGNKNEQNFSESDGVIIESSFIMKIDRVCVHLAGQAMGIAGARRDGLENGGVERALHQKFEDMTEVPLAMLSCTSARMSIQENEHGKEFEMVAATMDIVDQLCGTASAKNLMSAQSSEDVNVRFNYKDISPTSPEYKGIDTTMRLDTDEVVFFLHRPTIGSLWRMQEEFKVILAAFSVPDDEAKKSNGFDEDQTDRISSQLLLHFKSTVVTALCERENEHTEPVPLFDCNMTDLQMEMCSKQTVTEMNMSLGNLCIGDRGASDDNMYRRLIDINSDAASTGSRTNVQVFMHNHLAPSFPGYEYDVRVKFHDVKVIIVYSFIQKLLGYTSAFLPPSLPVSALPESERKAELLRRGEPRPFTMMYTVDMNAPELVFPRSSSSDQAFALDAKSVHIDNKLEWTNGKSHLDVGAILLDSTTVLLNGCSACVWKEYKRTTSMMPEGRDMSLSCTYRSPKWDPGRRAPAYEVFVDFLDHAEVELSDFEYRVLVALSSENFAEIVDVPQPLYEIEEIPSAESSTPVKAAAEETLVVLNINKMRLATFGASLPTRSKPLASFELDDMHVMYRNKDGKTMLSVTCPSLALYDSRVGVPEQARQAFGRAPGSRASETLFCVDAVMSESLYDCNFLLQSCRMMYDPEFGLAIYNFFVSQSEDESEGGLVDARLRQDLNFGSKKTMALENDTELSVSRRILCNSPMGEDEVELHGNGQDLVFQASTLPLVYVAPGRTLRFKDVRIVVPVGTSVCDFIQLDADAKIMTDEVDGVVVVQENRAQKSAESLMTQVASSIDYRICGSMPRTEVVFVDTSRGIAEYVLRMKTGAEFKYSTEQTDQEASFTFTEFQIAIGEWRAQPHWTVVDSSVVLKPIDIDGSMQATKDDVATMLRATDADFVLDAASIKQLGALSEGFLATLQSTGLYKQTQQCSTFTHVTGDGRGAHFWRPVPPPGFASLGDCVTLTDTPPSQSVAVITDAEGLTKAPLRFERVCALKDKSNTTVWRPIPPSGYYALGCVVARDDAEPSPEIIRCMRVDVLEVANYGAYIESENCAASLRQVNNCSRTFQVFGDGFEKVAPVDLNSPLLPEPFPVISASQSLNDGTNEMTCESNKLSTMTTFDCKRMWLNRDSRSRRSASIWRPRPLQGYASLGDCLIVGSSPPASGILVVEASDDTVAPPTSFARAGAIHDAHGNVLGVWSPVPPHGYVSCGDVLTRDILQAPPLTACVCVREDLASTVSRSGACTDPTQVTFDGIFVEDALWASREGHESAALWSSDPDAPLEHLPRWGLFQFSKSDARAPGQRRPRLSVLDYVKSRQIRDKAEELNISLNVSVPRVSLVLLEREAFSHPLLCASLTDTSFVMNGTSVHMEGNTMMTLVVSSYNSLRSCWEPIVDATNSYLKFTYSATGDESAPAGTSMLIKTITPFNVTLSQTFIAAMLRWIEWQAVSSTASVSTLHATSEDAIRYENCLTNQDVYLRYGMDSMSTICLKPGESREIVSGNRSSASYTLPVTDTTQLSSSAQMEKIPVRAAWFMYLKVISVDVPDLNELSQISASVKMEFPNGLGQQSMRTRSISAAKAPFEWNEGFRVAPRVAHGAATMWREYSEDVLMNVTVNDHTNSSNRAIASRSMSLKSLVDSLEVLRDKDDARAGILRVPRVEDDGDALELKIQIEFHEIGHRRRHALVDSELKDEQDFEDEMFVAFTSEGPWKSIDTHTPNATQIIMNASARCIARLSGPSACQFLPAATFKNETPHDLEVCVVPCGVHPDDPPESRSLTPRRARHAFEEVFENQRRIPLAGFSSKHLLPTERRCWSNHHGGESTGSIDEYTSRLLPAGFEWDGQWHVHKGENTDDEGWAYAMNLPDLKYPFPRGNHQGPLSMVRMRRWIRRRIPNAQDAPVQLMPTTIASLCQREVVKPEQSVGLIPSIIGPEAMSDLFVRSVSSSEPNAWATEVEEHGATWSCMISRAMEGSEIACVKEDDGVKRFIAIEVSADAVTANANAHADETGFEDCELLEDGYYNLNPEGMEWSLTAVAPHVVENHTPRVMKVTVFQADPKSPLSVRAVSEATISPRKSVPIHSVHPMTPYYLRVALDDGFNDMEPAQRLLPVSPMAIDALKSAGTLDAFEMFDTTFAVADQSDDASTSMDEIKLRNKDGRTAVLEARTDFGFVSNAPRTTVISANVIVVNKTNVDLVMRTSTAQLSTSDDGDSSMSKVKFLDTRATHSNRGVELLRKFVLRKAPKDGEVLCLEVGVANPNGASKPHLSPVIPMYERELLSGAVVVRAVCPDGSLYSVTVRMETGGEYAKYGSQVVYIEPRCVVTNQTGVGIVMAQTSHDLVQSALELKATDIDVPLRMQSADDDGVVCIKLPHALWSAPINLYSVNAIKDSMKIPLYTTNDPDDFELMQLHLDTSTLGVSKVSLSTENRHKSSILFENTSDVDYVAFRQVGATDDTMEPWRIAQPQSAKPFGWSRPQDAKKLAVCVLRKGSLQGAVQRVYDFEHLDPAMENETLPGLPVAKIDLKDATNFDVDGGDSVYFNFLPVTRRLRRGRHILRVKSYGSETISKHMRFAALANGGLSESRIAMLITESSLSLVDGAVSEIINCAAENVGFEYMTSAHNDIASMNLRIESMQVDDMNPSSKYPVVVRLLGSRQTAKRSLLSVKMVTKSSAGLCAVYPYIDVNFAPRDLQIAVHEPLVWRLVNFAKVFETGTSSCESAQSLQVVNAPITVGSFHVSSINLRLRFRSALYSRPRHAMPTFFTGVAFVNIDDGQLHLRAIRVERTRMLERAFWSMIVDSYTRQVARQALLLLVGVDVLDSFSQALGQASAGVAALSLDKKFSNSMNSTLGPDARKAESIQAGLATGGEMLAKGVFRGITGVFRKPVEGAIKGGAVGFAKGVGKGLIGAVTQPLAGGLAAVGRTAEGIAVGVDGVKSALGVNASSAQVRIREPRAQHADGVLRSFDRDTSAAQTALRTATRKKASVQASQGLLAMSSYARDKYLDSIEVNSRSTLVVLTDQRVVALRVPRERSGEYVALWHVLWTELLHTETQAPADVVLHLREYTRKKRIFEKTRITRVIKTTPGTNQMERLMDMIPREMARHTQTAAEDADACDSDASPLYVPCAGWRKVVRLDDNACVWAPTPPNARYAIFGHVLGGSEEPSEPVSVVLRTGGDSVVLSPPVRFELIYRERSDFTVWMPVPPAHFRAIGAVAVAGVERPKKEDVVCVRTDFLTMALSKLGWLPQAGRNDAMRSPDRRHFANATMWAVDNLGQTFIATRSREHPADDAALDVLDAQGEDDDRTMLS